MRETERARDLIQPRLHRREAVHGRKQHRPQRAEGDHRQHHRIGQPEQHDRDRHHRGSRQRAQEFQRRLDIGARGLRHADDRAEHDAEKRGEQPAIDHSLDGARGHDQEVTLGQAIDQRVPGPLRTGQKYRRDQPCLRDHIPKQDEQHADADAGQQPGETVELRPADHRSIRIMAAGPNRRSCDHSSSRLKLQPTMPSHTSSASINSGRNVCCARIML